MELVNQNFAHQPPLRVLFIFSIWTILCIGNSHAAEKVEATLVVSDALTTPGQAVKLEARLWEDMLLSQIGLGGESLEFFIGGKTVGTAMTGVTGEPF